MNRPPISNLSAFILSLVLAVAVWVLAVQDENPIITDDYANPIRVTLRGPDEGLAIVGQPLSQVTLHLKAPKRVWEETLRGPAFVVEADLTGLGAGRHDVPLRADYPGEEVKILEIRPSRLVVTLEQGESRDVPEMVDVRDEPALG